VGCHPDQGQYNRLRRNRRHQKTRTVRTGLV